MPCSLGRTLAISHYLVRRTNQTYQPEKNLNTATTPGIFESVAGFAGFHGNLRRKTDTRLSSTPSTPTPRTSDVIAAREMFPEIEQQQYELVW